MSGSEVEQDVNIQGHPTGSLQEFLRSYFGVETRNALEDLTAPGGLLRNAQLLISIENGREKPKEDFNLNLDPQRRVTERDLLRASAAYYKQVAGAVDVDLSRSGTLFCEVGNKFITVIATVGENEAYVTVTRY
jgi:hypothetical protein